ncbi:MAG: bifunctional proline dehydrogenase/L-glutamate gamma-semialdehyde dehydrogenase PutA, partial [Alphaproteobacteria bacterium]|nr:bifunctional proline dehydrogenase/L-glutamate gamma-semialdehyde dehydrogenase PutA [Alphaproteobacteria bacterium]
MIFAEPLPPPDRLRAAVRALHRADETQCVDELVRRATLPSDALDRIADRARNLVRAVRQRRQRQGGLDAFLHEYALSSREGIVLMCLAEALLRIPDADTADRLIRDKIGGADWERHVGRSDSLFVNASTWALMLTGRIVGPEPDAGADWTGVMKRMLARSGEPVIRAAVVQAMRIMGRQFVMGRSIGEALERAEQAERQGYRHSYDMLGEAARTAADAQRYMDSYRAAIDAIGRAAKGAATVHDAPNISVKLSALHPRYEFAQRKRTMDELVPRIAELARRARDRGIGLTVDAEEADRLDLSLDVIEAVSADPQLKGWDGYGLAVQAYQKRATAVIDWLADMARRHQRRLMVRLVKGAYWDSEIKRAQERGVEGYPVFTRKASTDVSYLACARALFADAEAFYPCFATHNAHTLAAVLELAGNRKDWEFQRLHGMGEALYEEVVGKDKMDRPCRVYAPVGGHEELLAYLVRRLLENGANTSFVNRLVDEKAPIDAIIADPVAEVRRLPVKPHPRIPLPRDLFRPERANSKGIDLSDPAVMAPLAAAMDAAMRGNWRAGPIIGGVEQHVRPQGVTSPADHGRAVGTVAQADAAMVGDALARAIRAQPGWDRLPAAERAACLDRAAELMEQNGAELMALAVREAGKTIPDALAELREAVDFCRYYAARARADFAEPLALPGPTGEINRLALRGRGVFACISPWNFPLAIFTGQVTAALAAGNAVIAKPAEQTPLIAAKAVELLHRAGVPADALHLLPGAGEVVGAALVKDARVAGIAFTGSTEVAKGIQRALADRPGPIVPLIAETGGQNAMIVDSSALPEQVTGDAIVSAFHSAGQRCSALRVMFVQKDIADRMLAMLAGAMDELVVGDPALLSTDVGPVIDRDARETLDKHAQRMAREGKVLRRCRLAAGTENGTFFAPMLVEIDSLKRLEREVFGPILHVVRYDADRLDQVLDQVAATGYGLTLGVHSRIDETVRH